MPIPNGSESRRLLAQYGGTIALPELDALTMAYNAVQQGAAGVDMGRNIFQSEAPKAMLAAVNAVVHQQAKPKEAYALFSSLKPGG